jgi:hypothetical protein
MKVTILTLCGLLLAALPLRAGIILNEVVAETTIDGFAADNGGRYDWIELHNDGGEDIDLQGSFLTDDAADLQKWEFTRSFVIEAGGYAIVFASDLDDLVEGQEHLNFKLDSGDGEYLALVASDGETITSDFLPGFPALNRDHSFGRVADGSAAILASPTPGSENTEAAAVPLINFFTISKDVIAQGEAITLTWETVNGLWITLNTGSGQDRMLEAADSVILRPKFDTTYTLTARNKYATVQERITVAVGPLVSSFTASPDVIATGGQTILRWTLEGQNEVISLDGQAIEQHRTPFAFTPTNLDLIPAGASWKTAPAPPGEGWTERDFDDSAWDEHPVPLVGKGFHRYNFEVNDAATLASVFVFPSEPYSFKATLNGTVIAGQVESFGVPNQLRRSFRIDPSLLIEGSNLLAIETQSEGSSLDLSLSAWRAQPVDTIVPVTLTTRNAVGQSSKTIEVTVLAAQTPLPPLPPLAITEMFWAYQGTLPTGPYRFFEVHNCGEDELDLTGIQFYGGLHFEFSGASETKLGAGGHALVVNDHPTFSEIWPGERPVIGQFEDALLADPYVFEFVEGLLDPFGRLIETVDSENLPPFQSAFQPYERVDCEAPSDEASNWFVNQEAFGENGGGGNPGEASFRILDFSFDPPFASPGDTVTLRWEISREGTLEISGGIGPVEGAVGGIELVVPLDARDFRFELVAKSLFASLEARASLILPPAQSAFVVDKTAIAPGEEVTFQWSQMVSYSPFRPVISPELPPGLYGGRATFAPLLAGYPKGASWRTFSHPNGPEAEWASPEYESHWRFRSAPIGFGDERIVYELREPVATTAYFRRTFHVGEVEEVNGLFFDLLNDGGIEVHLNGVEVLRDNLPAGPLDHTTTALNELAARERTFEVDPVHLVEGENTIVVGVHNEAADDPTLVFDMGLRAQRPVPASGRKVYTLTSSNDAGSVSSQITLLFREPVSVEQWQAAAGLAGNPAVQDQDGDGLNDLLEFATGSDPSQKSPHPIRLFLEEDGHLILTYPHNLAAGEVALVLESSSNLSTWTRSNSLTFQGSLTPPNSEVAEVRHRSYAPLRESLYFRLRASPK